MKGDVIWAERETGRPTPLRLLQNGPERFSPAPSRIEGRRTGQSGPGEAGLVAASWLCDTSEVVEARPAVSWRGTTTRCDAATIRSAPRRR
jgi:hypothetical protein